MKSLIAVLVAAEPACAVAVPASAQPTDNGPRPVSQVRHTARATPTGDDGAPAFIYALICCAAPSLGAGFMRARSARPRKPKPRSGDESAARSRRRLTRRLWTA